MPLRVAELYVQPIYGHRGIGFGPRGASYFGVYFVFVRFVDRGGLVVAVCSVQASSRHEPPVAYA